MSEENKLRAVWRWDSTAMKWDRIRMSEAKVGDWISIEREPGSKERFTGSVDKEPWLNENTGRWECDALGFTETVPEGPQDSETPV